MTKRIVMKTNTTPGTTPAPASLRPGEIAIRTDVGDNDLWFGDDNGDPISVFPQTPEEPTTIVTYNLQDYIAAQPGGVAQVDLIRLGKHDEQEADIVTAGVQAAFVAWWNSSASGQIVMPPGAYRINAEILGGRVDGTSVAQRIRAGELNFLPNGLERRLVWDASPAATFVIGDDWASEDFTENLVPYRFVWNWDDPRRLFNAVSGRLPSMYRVGSYETRFKCPGAWRFRNLNGCVLDFQNGGPRGEKWNWPGAGIFFDSHNNCQYHNVRSKGGATPLSQMVLSPRSGRFILSAAGQTLSDPSGSGRFAPPAGSTGDDFFIGRYGLVSSSPTANRHVVKFDGYVNPDTLSIDPAYAPPNQTGVNVTFGLPVVSYSAGGRTVTFDAPVLTEDMVGALIFIEGRRQNRTSLGIMTAYIDSVNPTTLQSCTIVGDDGADAVFNDDSASSGRTLHAWLGGNITLGQAHAVDYPNKNDDCTFYGAFAEKGGGHQLMLQACSGVRVYGGKGHGRDGESGTAGQTTGGDIENDYARTGLCAAFDNCEMVSLNGVKLSWASYLDQDDERAVFAKAYGSDNIINLRDVEFFGAANRTTLVSLKHVVAPHALLHVDGGENRISGYLDPGNDMVLTDISENGSALGANRVSVGAPVYITNTGKSIGYEDTLDPYRNLNRFEEVTIENGAITITGKSLVIVDTEGGASSDVLHTINGVSDGWVGTLMIAASVRDVILQDASGPDGGNIQTPDEIDITLGLSRFGVTLYRRGGNFRLTSAPNVV